MGGPVISSKIGAARSKLQPFAEQYALPLIFIGFVLGLPFGIGSAPTIYRDGDVSWHIAAGRWILAHHTIPTTDPFSFTAFGRAWIDTEWLAELVYAGAFNLLGYAGSAIVVVAALMALNAIIFFYLQPRVSPAVIAVALLAMNLVLGRFALARPHVLSWPLLAGWTVLLLEAAEEGRPPKLRWVLLLTIWTNVHASFPLALPVAGAIGLDALIATRWKHLREWILFGVASVIAMCVNANGVAGVLQPFHISSLSILPIIGEWAASTPTDSPIFFGLFFCGLAALLWTGVRFPIGRLLLLLVLLALSFAHLRHQSSFSIVAACIVPTLWRSRPIETRVPYWAIAGALPFLFGRALFSVTPPETAANPWPLIASVPPTLRSQPVFNEYSFGGPLILGGIKPYIDGRAEMYGDAFVSDYSAMTVDNFDAFQRAATKFDIQWIIMPWTEKYFVRELAESGQWCAIYRDKLGFVAVKKEGSWNGLCRASATAQMTKRDPPAA